MGVPLGIPTRLTPYRVGTVDCESISEVRDEVFVNNNTFKLLKGCNPAWFQGGELTFPPIAQKVDGFYKTRFGPAFEHNGVIYRRSDSCMRYGMRRLTNTRVPERPGYHEQLFRNQESFIRDQSTFLQHLKEKYTPHFADYMGAEEEMYKHYNDPHEKRALRIQAHDEMIEDTTCCQYKHPWLRDVLWKIKPQEWAKFGKKPRCICDLGVSASLRGFVLTNLLKFAQNDEPVDYLGGTFAFCKSPDPFELKRHFDLLRDPPGKFYFLYFSDDSCLAIRDENGDVQWFNLDISSCDSSHGAALFEALIQLMPDDSTRHDMKMLVKQCKSVLRIVSYGDKEMKIKVKPTRPVLLSGSTLTTAINNLANLLIGLSIVTRYKAAPIGQPNQTMIDAAADVGYILTGTEAVDTFHDVQFLKHSPVQDTRGEWHPMLNLGVLYRASGTCNGDLPGSKKEPVETRAATFQRSLLRGSYPYLSFDILENMRAAVGLGPTYAIKELEWKVTDNADKYPLTYVPDENIIKRYRLTQEEYLELIEVSRYPVGWFFNCTGATKVLEKDYKLRCVERTDINFSAGLEDEFGFLRQML